MVRLLIHWKFQVLKPILDKAYPNTAGSEINFQPPASIFKRLNFPEKFKATTGEGLVLTGIYPGFHQCRGYTRQTNFLTLPPKWVTVTPLAPPNLPRTGRGTIMNKWPIVSALALLCLMVRVIFGRRHDRDNSTDAEMRARIDALLDQFSHADAQR
jgi:hypothetical protein